ncbi:hypothetical protein [Paraburkholderia kururiensis]|uniref:hypothetical protein n=1 Tax=Paraburkholderia kururiensis TaxID=984307 RepID=UPI000F875131|nr:hypothetical protein [Paraburkholderia kururiensis]
MITRYDLLTEYCLQRDQELADALLGRKALFLDTRAWVHLRRAVSGDATQIAWLPVLQLLRQLVAAGRIFCPTTMTTISEVVSQADAATRLATAELLDELSLGIGFCAPDEQLLAEVDSEMRRRVDGYEPRRVIWTKGCMTFMRPSLLELDVSLPEGLPAFERAFDEVWNTPVSRLIEATGHLPGIDVSDAIERLNAGNWAHVDEISRFDRLLGVECRAVAELAANVTHARVRRHVVRQLITSGIPEIVAESPDERVEKAAIVAWLVEALQTDEGRRRLPALYTHAALHAQIRWMRNQRLRDNDLPDHHQVAQAIAHCDALLVDRATRNTLRAAQIRLDQLYGVSVLVTPVELSGYLTAIASDN